MFKTTASQIQYLQTSMVLGALELIKSVDPVDADPFCLFDEHRWFFEIA